jgi:hypothetical protein
MAIPTTREEFKIYCLRRLGEPVIRINVADDQVEDRIDDALQIYEQRHYEASERRFISYRITQEDIDNGYVTVPDGVIGVTRVLPTKTANAFFDRGIFDLEYQIQQSDMLSRTGIFSSSTEMSNFWMVKSHLNLINHVLGETKTYRFNRKTGRLSVENGITTVDQLLVFEVVALLDKDSQGNPVFGSVWSDEWLKDYATALIKRQWGANMKKFDNVQLPGGVTMNGQTLFDEANQEIEALLEEMSTRYEDQPMFFVG